MMANPDALEQVLFGDDGVVTALGAEQWLIDMSTVGPQMIHSVARRVPNPHRLVDAPVRGSVPRRPRAAAIYVGATPTTFAHVQPLLATLGTTWAAQGRARRPSWSST
jgi:3-hydroxyisobutyrate dehydrogenase-like beta-hydroxyacid dehydrogenase